MIDVFRFIKLNDIVINTMFLTMTLPEHCYNLIRGNEYFIKLNNETYKGTYSHAIYPRYFESSEKQYVFVKVSRKGETIPHIKCEEQHLFYDIKKIRENVEKARLLYEERTLKQILKKIIDEMFEW